MPSVIDSLVLELGLDATKFTEGQKAAMESMRKMQDEVEKGGKNVESHGKKIEQYFDGLKRGAITLMAGFLGARGITDFVTHLTRIDAAASRLSRTLNMDTKELTAWQGVAKQTGGSAETMAGTLQGLTDQLQNLALGIGNPAFLGPLRALGVDTKKANGEFKTAGELLIDINRAVQGMDPARARALMTSIGLDGATVNTLLLGTDALKKLLAEQKNLAELTTEDGKAAEALAQSWERASQAATGLGRSILTNLTPALSGALDRFTQIFRELKAGYIVSPDSVVGRLFGMKALPSDLKGQSVTDLYPGYTTAPAPAVPSQTSMSDTQIEAAIRRSAVKHGVDPDVAVKVWEREGKYGIGPSKQSAVVKNGRREESYGPFQLYMGGGLGNTFQKQGLGDPRDPSTFEKQIDFSMQHVSKNGWGPWYGARGVPGANLTAPRGGAVSGGGGGNSTSVQINKIEVNAPNATDAAGVAAGIKDAMDRQVFGASANYGQN